MGVFYLLEITAFALIGILEDYSPLFRFERKSQLVRRLNNITLQFLSAITIYIFSLLIFQWENSWLHGHWVGILPFLPFSASVKMLFAFVAYDFGVYVFHRISHQIPFLWKFHRVHHTDEQVDVTTAIRHHVGEHMISFLFFRGIFFPILGLNLQQMLFYDMCLMPLVFFHHSNVALPKLWDRFMRILLVSPNMHRIHHSKIYAETNSNYASFFSFWDRLGGTSCKHENPKMLKYGLTQFHAKE